jgi:capsular exopolysaccharide synthesis family protein
MINFSELLWKAREIEGKVRVRPAREGRENPEAPPALREIPAEEVVIRPDSRLVFLTEPSSAAADRLRLLRMRLREFKDLAKLQKLVITSPLPQDGKSTIALNLATALAEGGKRSVVLVEGDLHHPSLADRLGLKPRLGLADCIQRGLDPLPAIQRLQPLNFCLLQAGQAQSNPTELLQSGQLAGIFDSLTSHFDWVLVDTPPVVPLTDALSFSRQADANLLVVRAGQTPRKAIEDAVERLGQKHIVGIVLNGAEGLNRMYSQYYGYYETK